MVLAGVVLGRKARWGLSDLGDVIGAALPPVAAVILITGAGGAFGHVLGETGIGGAVAESLASTGMPILLLAWLISTISKAALHVPRQVVGRISLVLNVGVVGSARPRCTSLGRFHEMASWGRSSLYSIR